MYKIHAFVPSSARGNHEEFESAVKNLELRFSRAFPPDVGYEIVTVGKLIYDEGIRSEWFVVFKSKILSSGEMQSIGASDVNPCDFIINYR